MLFFFCLYHSSLLCFSSEIREDLYLIPNPILREEPCYSIAAAGAIMRTYLNETGGDLLRAVGDYHSHTVELNLAYRGQVVQAARDMFVTPGGGHHGMARPMRRAIRRRYQGRPIDKSTAGWEHSRSQPG